MYVLLSSFSQERALSYYIALRIWSGRLEHLSSSSTRADGRAPLGLHLARELRCVRLPRHLAIHDLHASTS